MKFILRVPKPRSSFACYILLSSLLGASLAAPAPTQPQPAFELRDGDRVLFIGDTFFEREVDYGHIEMRLTRAFPDRI